MIITILTLFPELFPPFLNSSILGRAQKKGKVRFIVKNIRDVAEDKHKSVDDRPYGGGAGMIMRVDIVHKALLKAIEEVPLQSGERRCIILTEAAGKQFTQKTARDFARYEHLVIICGHYEGIDARIKKFIDVSITIGPYVLTCGELPSLVITDAVTRLIPGVLEKEEATVDESYTSEGITEPPPYTRPPDYGGLKVPKTLLSGNHAEIHKWKLRHSKKQV